MAKMNKTNRLDRSIVKVGKMDKLKLDVVFWQTRSPQERIDALEQIREEFHSWKYGTTLRLERVYGILKDPEV